MGLIRYENVLKHRRFAFKTRWASHEIVHITAATRITQYVIFQHITIDVAEESTDISISNKFIGKCGQVSQCALITDFRQFININQTPFAFIKGYLKGHMLVIPVYVWSGWGFESYVSMYR